METSVNPSRIAWDLRRPRAQYEVHQKNRKVDVVPPETFLRHSQIYLEIGAGTGWFFLEMARLNPNIFYIAIERDRMRGNRLVYRAEREGLSNVAAYRGNVIPPLIHGIPTASLERIYILYPCPWPKTSQRKNRWYLHPVMPHIVRLLKPGGLIIWASDQKFYIDEAKFVCENLYPLTTLSYGELKANPYNDLDKFSQGRTKFEHHFLASGQACFDLVVQKSCSQPESKSAET